MKDKELTLVEAQKIYVCKKAFEIMIDDKLHQIWDIEGYEHELGKMNGATPTYWLDYSDELVPYLLGGSHRICWEVNYKQNNSTKYKWDEWRINGIGNCIIKANGKEIYSFFSRDVGYGLSKAQSLMVTLTEHPYNFLHPEEMEDRKIWYYGLPAIVHPNSHEPGTISIEPDYSKLEKDAWWDLLTERKNPVLLDDMSDMHKEDLEMERMDDEEWKDYGKINHGDALWDGMINWFRD